MSGDVQPRKRKDKRRKKDASSSEKAKAEAEFIARKLSLADESDEGGSSPVRSSSSHGSTPAPSEADSFIHVHHEGGTGGHWCAKIVFFALLGVLVFLIGLIIIENRGLTDVGTPLPESKFAAIFDGWVDEGPAHDDHHDEHTLELKHQDVSHEDELDDEHDGEIEDIEEEHGDSEDEHTDDDDEDSDLEADELDDPEHNPEDADDHAESDEDVNSDSDEVDLQETASKEVDEIDHDDDEYLNSSQEDDDDDSPETGLELPFEEVDSTEEEVVDNTAGEEEQLAAKQAEQLALEQEDSGIGMRVGIGVALVVVAYCVLARKWHNADDEDGTLELDVKRRMTLISDEDIIDEAENEIEEKISEIKRNVPTMQSAPATRSLSSVQNAPTRPSDFAMQSTPTTQSSPSMQNDPQRSSLFARPKQIIHRYEEDEDDEVVVKATPLAKTETSFIQKYNVEEPEDEGLEEEEEEDELEEEEEKLEDEEEPVEKITREEIKSLGHDHPRDEIEDESVEDVIDEEEDIIEEEEEEEDISEELDDSDLMKKLEEKYGKLPQLEDDQPEGHSDEETPITAARKKIKPSGGKSASESDSNEEQDENAVNWKHQYDLAQAEMDEGKYTEAYNRFQLLVLSNHTSALARIGRARSLDKLAEQKKSNAHLKAAIDEYIRVLEMDIDEETFHSVIERAMNRIKFQGRHLDRVPLHEKLISKYPSKPEYRNHLAITYLLGNKIDKSRKLLQETIKKWPNDGVALVHYGFILKTTDNNLTGGVEYMQRGVDTGDTGALDGRFLFHLGDAWARLGNSDKANEIYQLGANIGVFLHPQQRSLYNVDRLTGRPWWKTEQTPFGELINNLVDNWKKISKEALNVFTRRNYKPEQENLKDTGDWSQYELFMRGIEDSGHCQLCPVTCTIIRKEAAAASCRRGQVKFSAMQPGTHVFAHTGPTNCRLRAHLGLTGTAGTFIRVANDTRSWKEGKVFIFDDSFEHEVWHNGTELRIVLIVDLWHPELTKEERNSLPSI